MQFVTGPDGKPTEAILYGIGAQATFQNTAGQVVVVTNNSPGTVTIPIDSNGNPSIPAGINLLVVSTNPSIPSTPTSSSSGVNGNNTVMCVGPCTLAYLQTPSLMLHVVATEADSKLVLQEVLQQLQRQLPATSHPKEYLQAQPLQAPRPPQAQVQAPQAQPMEAPQLATALLQVVTALLQAA